MTNDDTRAGDRPDRADSLEIGDALRLLSNDRRLLMFEVLAETDGSVTVDELVHRIRAREAADGSGPSPEEVRISLHHVHFPKAEVNDLLDWSRADGRVRYRPSPRLEGLLDAVAELSDG